MVEPGVAEHRPQRRVRGQALDHILGRAGVVAGPGVAQLGEARGEYVLLWDKLVPYKRFMIQCTGLENKVCRLY